MRVGKHYFPVPYEGYNARDIRLLRRLQGGVIAYGRYHVLLGILYQAGGRFDLDELAITDLEEELELTACGVTRFLEDCSKCGLISSEFLARGVVASEGVCKQLDYIRQQSERGKKGGRPKKADG